MLLRGNFPIILIYSKCESKTHRKNQAIPQMIKDYFELQMTQANEKKEGDYYEESKDGKSIKNEISVATSSEYRTEKNYNKKNKFKDSLITSSSKGKKAGKGAFGAMC